MSEALTFPPPESYLPLIHLAKAEDVQTGDVTSALLIAKDKHTTATLVQKSPGVIAGLPLIPAILNAYDPALKVEYLPNIQDGHYTPTGQKTPIAKLHGPLASLLTAERVVLNFLQRLSGVATVTHTYVQAVAGTGAKILDTRKTIPGFRLLDKYAVRAGGGHNHRIGLYDGVLIKDNHIAHIPLPQLASTLQSLVTKAQKEFPNRMFMVEVDTLNQLTEVLKVGEVTHILLDNMDCPTMTTAVQMRNAANQKGKVELEASGGITLQTIRAIAQTGVDRISIGALTHSVPALDIGLDVDE